MTRVLLVRMSSLGDIIHTFPAATDMQRHVPDLVLDWVVEGEYVELARMHPAVQEVIAFSLRRWRRAMGKAETWRELGAARRALAAHPYDAIIETQGLMKSAWVAKQARGPIHGFGPRTAREPIVARLYTHRYEFAPSDHKILRYRTVAARALGYTFDPPIDYGLVAPPRPAFAPAGPYVVMFHSTARAAKLWDEAAWIALAQHVNARGRTCVLPWGSDEERQRSERIAGAVPQALVAPRMSITEAGGLIGGADAVVGVDTGLMHLAAALKVPVVGVFCDSEPADAHPVGLGPSAYRGGVGRPPAAAAVIDALGEVAPGLS